MDTNCDYIIDIKLFHCIWYKWSVRLQLYLKRFLNKVTLLNAKCNVLREIGWKLQPKQQICLQKRTHKSRFWLLYYLHECLAHKDTYMHKNDFIEQYIEQISQNFPFFISLRPSEIFIIKKVFIDWTIFFIELKIFVK